MQFHCQTIGVLSTPFKEKFGVPRQSLMMSEAKGILKLKPHLGFRDALRNLEQFSHIWLVFIFHKSLNRPWHPLIETPRVDAAPMGVFATRSPHRPSPLGLSAVKLELIDYDAPGGIEIHVSGLDILDETPVVDIKPYLPYADCIPEANSGWIKSEIDRHPVSFSPESLEVLQLESLRRGDHLQALIRQMLELDPRPTSQRRTAPISAASAEGMKFAFRVMDLDVHWEIRQGGLYVFDIKLLEI